jgi:hypothetical protein
MATGTIDPSIQLLVRLLVAELAEQPRLVERELELGRSLRISDRVLADARLGRSDDPKTAACLILAAKMVRDHGRYLRLTAGTAKDVGVTSAALHDLARTVGEVLVDAWVAGIDQI